MSSPEIFFVVSDLRQRPEFTKAVADRVWQAWWQGRGYPLDYIEGRVAESLDGAAVPFAVVAHEDGQFLGTASAVHLICKVVLGQGSHLWVQPQGFPAAISRVFPIAAPSADDIFIADRKDTSLFPEELSRKQSYVHA
jgi:hypothetical protein